MQKVLGHYTLGATGSFAGSTEFSAQRHFYGRAQGALLQEIDDIPGDVMMNVDLF